MIQDDLEGEGDKPGSGRITSLVPACEWAQQLWPVVHHPGSRDPTAPTVLKGATIGEQSCFLSYCHSRLPLQLYRQVSCGQKGLCTAVTKINKHHGYHRREQLLLSPIVVDWPFRTITCLQTIQGSTPSAGRDRGGKGTCPGAIHT